MITEATVNSALFDIDGFHNDVNNLMASDKPPHRQPPTVKTTEYKNWISLATRGAENGRLFFIRK